MFRLELLSCLFFLFFTIRRYITLDGHYKREFTVYDLYSKTTKQTSLNIMSLVVLGVINTVQID